MHASPESAAGSFFFRRVLFLFALIWSVQCLLMPTSALAAAKPTYTIRFARKTLFVGEKMQIETQRQGNITLTFSSSDKKILSVSRKGGKLKAKKTGKATITVTAKWKRRKKTYTQKKTYKIKVKELKLKNPSPEMEVGEEAVPRFSQKIGSRPLTLSSTNRDFVTVADGTLHARYPGNTDVTVRVGDYLTFTMKVKVKARQLETAYEKLLINPSHLYSTLNLADAVADEMGEVSLDYTMSDPSMGSITDGIYMAEKAGRNTIAVTGGGMLKHITITSYVWSAHRGYLDMYPENTIDAFLGAGREGAAICETDLQVTGDGRLVCLHNTTVNHMTDGTGSIHSYTYEQARALTIDNGNGLEDARYLYIADFEEYLQICKQFHMIAEIELKSWSYLTAEEREQAMRDVYALIQKYDMENRCFLISFYASQLQSFYQTIGDTPIPFGAINDTALNAGREMELPNLTSHKATPFGNFTSADYSPRIGRQNLSYSSY